MKLSKLERGLGADSTTPKWPNEFSLTFDSLSLGIGGLTGLGEKNGVEIGGLFRYSDVEIAKFSQAFSLGADYTKIRHLVGDPIDSQRSGYLITK